MSASQRHHGNTQFAVEYPGRGVVARACGVEFEHRSIVELQPAGGEPIAQQRRPRGFKLLCHALEIERRVLSAWNDRALRFGLVTDGLYIVAVRTDHKGAEIMRVIDLADSGGPLSWPPAAMAAA
jgi:hypothetical protein